MKIFLSGHRDFGNRGCEAIVRSTAMILRKSIPSVEIIVPTTNKEKDIAQWPEAKKYGVVFSECLKLPIDMRIYGRLRKYLKWLNNFYPPVSIPKKAMKLIEESDIILSVGGDNYSPDYSLPYLPLLFDNYAMSINKKVILWGASVGPFDQDNNYFKFIKNHMQRFSHVYLREYISEQYCKEQLGIERCSVYPDPAFILEPDYSFSILDNEDYSKIEEKGIIGVNISPVILSKLGGRSYEFIDYMAESLAKIKNILDVNFLLVPHVIPYKGVNDDRIALYLLAEKLNKISIDHYVISEDYNSVQLKQIIGHCQAFIGARTHATIAAMSMNVPTVSIGYSVKALGINNMVYGSNKYVIDYKDMDSNKLVSKLLDALEETNLLKTNIKNIMKLNNKLSNHVLDEFLLY